MGWMPSFQNSALRVSIASVKISPVIHAVLLLKYQKPHCLPVFFLKHHGCFTLPMKRSWIFLIPVAFMITRTVIQDLSNFFPGICFVESPWFSIAHHKNPVSSQLNRNSGSFSSSKPLNLFLHLDSQHQLTQPLCVICDPPTCAVP